MSSWPALNGMAGSSAQPRATEAPSGTKRETASRMDMTLDTSAERYRAPERDRAQVGLAARRRREGRQRLRRDGKLEVRRGDGPDGDRLEMDLGRRRRQVEPQRDPGSDVAELGLREHRRRARAGRERVANALLTGDRLGPGVRR